jgi:hypothetical protein
MCKVYIYQYIFATLIFIQKVGVVMHNEKFLKILLIIVIIAFFTVSILITLNGLEFISIGKIDNNGNINQNVNISLSTNKEDKININKCSLEALINLPMVDKVKAQRIIENRPYSDIWELDKISGIGRDTIDAIKYKVVCE